MPPIKFDIFFDEISLAIFFFVIVGITILIVIYLNFLHIMHIQSSCTVAEFTIQASTDLILFKKNK